MIIIIKSFINLLDSPEPYHFRECDLKLRDLGIKFFPITLGPMRKLTERGMRLRQLLASLGMEVIETYPGGAQDVLGIPRKQHGVDSLVDGLRSLGIKGLHEGVSGDEADAATCAYVAILYAQGRCLALGDADEGLLYLPKKHTLNEG